MTRELASDLAAVLDFAATGLAVLTRTGAGARVLGARGGATCVATRRFKPRSQSFVRLFGIELRVRTEEWIVNPVENDECCAVHNSTDSRTVRELQNFTLRYVVVI